MIGAPTTASWFLRILLAVACWHLSLNMCRWTPCRIFGCSGDRAYHVEGRPPNVIEDQVSYPIVTALLAAPHVKAVRAQTMSAIAMYSLILRMAPTSIGRAHECWSTYSKFKAGFPPEFSP